jgi:hypothetical protein
MPRKKPLALAMSQYLQPLEPFIEPATEMDKTTLLERVAGSVEYSVLTVIKLLVFARVGKDERGDLYLV